jgi:CubicO group peptidase (beta-lactamase class C family)
LERKIVATAEPFPLRSKPGEVWAYNNTGYVLLGVILETLDKRPYAESLAARITGPLGMKETFFTSERILVPNRATGYGTRQGKIVEASYLNMDWPYAAGSLESSARDLIRFDRALVQGKLLPSDLWKAMRTEVVLPGGKTTGYGLGLDISKLGERPVLGHSGGIHGFNSDWVHVPDLGISVVVLINSDGMDPRGDYTASKIAQRLLALADASLKP